MKRIRRLRQKIGDLITVLMIVAGLTMAISSLAVEDKVSATCGDMSSCSCFTTDVGCTNECTLPQRCIVETGQCNDRHLFCHYAYCSAICGV